MRKRKANLFVFRFLIWAFVTVFATFSYSKCAGRSDRLNTEITHATNGKINVVFHNEQKINRTDYRNAHYLQKKQFQLIEDHFRSFIGLESFKKTMKEIYASFEMNRRRKSAGLVAKEQVMHMIFKGNPGTGKTTIAREVAKLFKTMNILSRGHFIEAERADLVGEYIGETAQKTRRIIDESLGGVLFIDEAYALARGGPRDFGREALDTLVKQMEDYHDDLVIILAGYTKEMDDLIRINPGLSSRFPFHITFYDYSVDELIDIAKQMLQVREYELDEKALWKLKTHLRTIVQQKDRTFANARYVRNIIEKSIRLQAVRLIDQQSCSIEQLMTIRAEDIEL